ncbi:Cysteine-rich motor neuron 1 protein [Chamberlinius hualienensis]
MKYRIGSLLICLLVFGSNVVFCLICNCNETTCLTVDCVGGKVKDVCGCCDECARQLNEPCDGIMGVDGQCDVGLICLPRKDRFRRDDVMDNAELSAGICAESPELLTVADCVDVKCPKAEKPLCPSDSFPLPRKMAEGDCCSKPSGCMCLPLSCEEPKCLPNQRLKLIKAGDGNPGSCCPTYQCVTDDSHCVANGVVYFDGEEWKSDICTICKCKGNVTFCNSIQCNHTSDTSSSTSSSCAQMKVPPGECCAVCTGCVSGGVAYNNSEAWREGDCKICTCQNGEVKCEMEFCSVPCENPKKIPGQCCPHCDEPSEVTMPSRCPPLTNCSLLCANGLYKDNSGCYHCHCLLDDCPLLCEHGYALDSSDIPICKCKCLPLVNCDKKCLHGLKNDASGCPVCRCFSCRSPSCAIKCPNNSYVRNSRGCRTCKCMNVTITTPQRTKMTSPVNKIPYGSEKPTEMTSLSKRNHCKLKDGVRADDTMWHDGCRTCYCHDGREFCSLISCPTLPNCQHPVTIAGECCPKCIESVSSAVTPSHVPNTNDTVVVVCPSMDGGFYLEGEMWALDSCTNCVCHSGQMFCESHHCSPSPCQNPMYLQGSCCPHCPETKKAVLSNRSCSVDGGRMVHEDGSLWWADDCQSCKCSYGKIHCFPVKCPKLNCDRPVLKKGQCCPFCVEMKRTSCLHDDILHDSGEVWMLNECTQCICLNGQTKCQEKICNQQCNSTVVKLSGQCCPLCLSSATNKSIDQTMTLATDQANVTTSKDVESGSCWDSILKNILIIFTTIVSILLLIALVWLLRRKFSSNWVKKPELPLVKLNNNNKHNESNVAVNNDLKSIAVSISSDDGANQKLIKT